MSTIYIMMKHNMHTQNKINMVKKKSSPTTARGKTTRSQAKTQQEDALRANSVSVASTNVTTEAGNLEDKIQSMVDQMVKMQEHIQNLNEKVGNSEVATEKSTVTKKSVHIKAKSCPSSKWSRMTVDITTELQKRLNLSMRSFIRDRLYSNHKFIRGDAWANGLTRLAVKENYVSLPLGWTSLDFSQHMLPHIYKCYGGIRHNSQSLARKYFMGKGRVCWEHMGIVGENRILKTTKRTNK